MTLVTIEEHQWIDATPEAVYQLLADYKHGHPSILPKKYFKDLRVIKGGFGAGTEIEVDMEVMGVKRTMHMQITEPEKGVILSEVDEANGIDTQFTFDDVDGGCLLTIHTKMEFANSLMGFMEKLTTPPMTRSIYRKELQLIADHFEKVAQPV